MGGGRLSLWHECVLKLPLGWCSSWESKQSPAKPNGACLLTCLRHTMKELWGRAAPWATARCMGCWEGGCACQYGVGFCSALCFVLCLGC